MEVAVSAALWVVGKALEAVKDGLLEVWTASVGLGPNINALKVELLYAQWMLDNSQGRDVRNPALKELLHMLRQLAYDADDVLDELEYFRIQDALDGTYHAADVHAGGYVHGLVLNAHHTARASASKLKISACSRAASRGDPDVQEDDAKQGCLSGVCSCGRREINSTPPPATNRGVQEVDGGCMPKAASTARNAAHAVGKHLPCYSLPSVHDDAHTGMPEDSNMPGSGRRYLCGARPSKARQRNRVVQTPKVQLDRVEISRKMKDIVEQLKPVCATVSNIFNLEILGSNRTTTQDVAMNRPKTTPAIIEPKLYGRDNQIKDIVDRITHEYCANELTVLPIVGPGGIGKTTLTQHMYKDVQSHFQVSIWICVSRDFNSNKLLQEIVKKIPEVNGEKKHCSEEELIEQRLQSKRFLLVLDDMWTYHDDEWKKLLAPFRKGGTKGNVVIVTTRIRKVANKVRTINCSIELERLGPEDIMCFFEVCVFGDQQAWKDHPELLDVGSKIVGKLKGFPLAAKTVGRLLRNQLTKDHWARVLESKEWETQTSKNDIMPALKLSYDFLPIHLQQCFSYCALFPEDYQFDMKELIHLWIGLDILHSSDRNMRIEDVGLSYLNELVGHGFFKKEKKKGGCTCYVIHDLLRELAVKVSSYECLSISSSNVKSIQIPPSVRHMSIIIGNTDVKDRMTFEDYKRDLSALDKRLKVQNLRTLMLFGEYHGSFAKTFGDIFREAKALRAILLFGASYNVEDMLHNFSKLVHLRYLRINSVYNTDVHLPSAMFRFYHLEVIDLEEWYGFLGSTRHVSNLVKLRHFLVPRYKLQLHSDIFEVGKLIFFKELRRFEVGKESKGFELSQLAQLEELGGSLGIYNLEKVQAEEEASESKLEQKNHIHKLILEWDIKRSNKDPTREEDVLESLVPHSNLQDLCIRGHGGTNCPTWLGTDLSVESLESLCLDDVSWKNLPPLGELWLVNELGQECQCPISSQSFKNLKRLELVKIPILKKWVENGACHLFSHLEVLIIKDCSELMELPFSRSTSFQPQQEANMTWFPRLRELKIVDCPKLLSLAPIPWTRATCSANIERVGSGFKKLNYSKNHRSELELEIEGKDGQDSVLWNGFSFYNLIKLEVLVMKKCPPLPLNHLQMLTSLKALEIHDSSNVMLTVEGERNHFGCTLPVERIVIERSGASGKELTQLLSHFPKLSKLTIKHCHKITGVGVVEQQQQISPSSSANKIGEQQQQTRGEEEEIAAAGGGGLLLLPPQLQELVIYDIPELSLHTNSLDDDTAAGGGLQGLHSLRSLEILNCPKFLSSYLSSPRFPFPTSLEVLLLRRVETLAPLSNLTSLTRLHIQDCGDLRGEGLWPLSNLTSLRSLGIENCPKFLSSYLSSPRFPFPTSLEDLDLRRVEGMETLAPLSNLTSLTRLRMENCGDLRGEGLWPLLAQGHLTELLIYRTPKFFIGSEPHEQEILRRSSKLRELVTDDVAGVLAAPICSLLSSSLTELYLLSNEEVERFTKEQEEALRLLTSLQELRFGWCSKLPCLPAGLHRLTNLKRLEISSCPAIRSLPKGGLPRSLQELEIRSCPAIRSLPKELLSILSSLRVLDVSRCNSEELRRQCRKLTGTIPIIKT